MPSAPPNRAPNVVRYGRFLVFVAGLGGLLYGIDVGIIAAALLYLNRTINLTVEQTSIIVAAVLGGGMFSSLVAGVLADWLGRKKMMIVSGLLFVVSVGLIVVSQGFVPLFLGRLLQGFSGGVIAVVVPLYLAECLGANIRGRGTAIFQFMLTFGIVIAAVVGWYYTRQAEAVIAAEAANQQLILAAANHAWRGMFLAIVYPGLIFFLGSFFLSESPRWLFRHGKEEQALAALRRSSPEDEAQLQLHEMRQLAQQNSDQRAAKTTGNLLQRKYVVPFVLACVILTCNQSTGINSILQFLVVILKQAGMSGAHATQGDVAVKVLNCVMTVVAIALVDRKGRKFLLKLGTAGIIVSLLAGAFVFHRFESERVDIKDRIQADVKGSSLELPLSQLQSQGTALGGAENGGPVGLTVLYSFGKGDRLETVLSGDPDPVAPHSARSRRRPAPYRARPLWPRSLGDDRLAGHRLPLPLHRLLRPRPRSRRLAHPVGTHAHPHPLRRHGRRPAAQPGDLHSDRRRLFARSGKVRLLRHVHLLGAMHGRLFHRRGLFPAGDQRQNARRD